MSKYAHNDLRTHQNAIERDAGKGCFTRDLMLLSGARC
jgi:hypothetical protein